MSAGWSCACVALHCWAVSGLGCGSLLAPVLARIADLAADARTDHSGELLRFADRGQTEEVRVRLSELGYQSEVAGDGASQVEAAWFTPDDLAANATGGSASSRW